jgi:hypothetical protein
MSPQNYEDLEIYRMARALAAEIHKMTLEELSGFEMYEVASQRRRSSKSVVWNIVEGLDVVAIRRSSSVSWFMLPLRSMRQKPSWTCWV